MLPKKRLIFSFTIAILISLSIFFRKLAITRGVPPLTLLIQFLIISSLLLSLNIFIFHKKYLKKIEGIKYREWKNIFLAGSLIFFGFFLSNSSLRLTSSINYSFLNKSNVIFIPLLAFLFLKERITKEKIMLIIIFAIGIFFITTSAQWIIPQPGDVLVILATLLFSIYNIMCKNLGRLVKSEILSWLVTSFAAIFSLMLSVILKINIFSSQEIGLIFLSGLTEALIILLINKTIQITNMTYYVLMIMFSPFINLILGILWLNESIKFIQIIGGIILIASGIMVQRLAD